MTLDEICKNAEGTTFGERALKTKDNAMEQVRCLMIDIGFTDLDKDGYQEDIIESYCHLMQIKFDSTGHITDINFPNWLEKIVYEKVNREYLEEGRINSINTKKG